MRIEACHDGGREEEGEEKRKVFVEGMELQRRHMNLHPPPPPHDERYFVSMKNQELGVEELSILYIKTTEKKMKKKDRIYNIYIYIYIYISMFPQSKQ